MTSKVEIKSINEIEKMHTGSLMSRRKALLACEESFEVSDQITRASSDLIEFKNTPEWNQAYSELKSVLSKRENVLNKQERKNNRKNLAKG